MDAEKGKGVKGRVWIKRTIQDRMDGEKNKMKVRAIQEKREKEKIGQVGQQEKKGLQNDVILKKKRELNGWQGGWKKKM